MKTMQANVPVKNSFFRFLVGSLIVFLCHLPWTYAGNTGQICMFYGYEADCRYRIDGRSLSHIEVEINHCNDPIDITFEIENEKPRVEWSHTFSNDNEVIDVPGFRIPVQLQVLLSVDKDKRLWIRADFDADGHKRAFFIDQKLDIRNEECVQLNKAGRIAVGLLIALLVIAAVLLGVLLYYRRRRRRAGQRHRTLVEEMEPQSCSEVGPPGAVPSTHPVVIYSVDCATNRSSDNQQVVFGQASGDASIKMDNGVTNGHTEKAPGQEQNAEMGLDLGEGRSSYFV